MSRPRRAVAVALPAALAALLAPSVASAAVVAVAPCAVTLPGQRTVAIQGSGYTPGSSVTLAADGQTLGSALVAADGTFRAATAAPQLSSERRTVQTFQLTAADAAGVTATTPLQITRVTATLPDRARPRSRVRVSVFGFAPGRRVWVHIRRGDRTLGSFRIGTAQAPCGRVSRRMRYMPLRRWSTGTYDYVFQHSSRYRPSRPAVRLSVSIVRRGSGF